MSRAVLEVSKPGAATTVRGGPVTGRAWLGVNVGGAADPRSLALANLAVGNAPFARGLEVVLAGPTLRALADVDVCVAGAPFALAVDGAEVPLARPVHLRANSVLRIGACPVGLRCAVAVAGGLTLDDGVDEGAPLIRGVRLGGGLADPEAPRIAAPPPVAFDGDVVLRVTGGAQAALFDDGAHEQLTSTRFVVGRDSDRRGVRLEGGRVEGGREILTEGASLGAVQIPPSGEPIVLGVDRTTTGG